MRPVGPLCLAVALLAGESRPQSTTIRGAVAAERPTDAPLLVFAVRLHVRADGHVVPPGKREIFAASARGGTTTENGRYTLEVVPGHYSVFGFADIDGNGAWDPGTPEPFGWYTTRSGERFDALELTAEGTKDVDITLRAATPFATETRTTKGGALRRIKGYPVLQLRGDAKTRGHAHGFLVGQQIVDFFRFYILEDKLRSPRAYLDGFAKFLHSHFAHPQDFLDECEAVIDGMVASGIDMHVPELGRAFCLTDLLAINSYIETRAMRSSCTQFAAWGPRTAGTDVDGGMITGRNMDGEIDIRKVTVSHFLLFAVDPDEPGRKRYVSMMWPGFVATISGINEDGFYTMENAGGTGPGPVVDELVPFSWTMREALSRLGADATPKTVQALVDGFDNPVGGACGPGCVTLFAVPFHGQTDPAFVLEGDRFGDAMRRPGAVRPELPFSLVASNHHHVYGADPDRPGTYFGRTPSFSSRWRYEAGMHKLEAWSRTDRRIGTEQMRALLQTVAHGTTEYAVITRPNAREFDVAVASMAAELWDAPYRAWTRYAFDEVFATGTGAGGNDR